MHSRSVRGARCTSGWLDPVKARHIIINIKHYTYSWYLYLICTYSLEHLPRCVTTDDDDDDDDDEATILYTYYKWVRYVLTCTTRPYTIIKYI